MTLEEKLSIKELEEKIIEWKKDLTPEDLKSVLNQIEDPAIKLIINKLLLEKKN